MAISIGGAILGAAAISAGAGLASQAIGPKGTNKSGIIHTVQDAKAAGIHPLYALGATPGYAQAPSGSALGEGISSVGRAASTGLRQYGAHLADQPTTSESNQAEANLAYTNAQTDLIKQNMEASKLAMMMQRTNQTGYGRGDVVRVGLPDLEQGYGTKTTTEGKRLVWFRDAAGRVHQVDQRMAPSEPLEQEWGEVGGELQGAARGLKGLYKERGIRDWISMEDIVDYLRNR